MTAQGPVGAADRPRGQLLGALGGLIAVGTVLVSADLDNLALIVPAMVVGTAVGAPAARRVPMTAMPQLVALFNGIGGGAAAAVALVEFARSGQSDPVPVLLATVFSVLVGCMSFTGSALTFVKLQELMTGAPVTFPFGRTVSGVLAAVTLGMGVAVVPTRSTTPLGRQLIQHPPPMPVSSHATLTEANPAARGPLGGRPGVRNWGE